AIGELEIAPLRDLGPRPTDGLLWKGDRRELAELVGDVVRLVDDEVHPVEGDPHPLEEGAPDVGMEEERVRRGQDPRAWGELLRELVRAEVLRPAVLVELRRAGQLRREALRE